MDFLILYVFTKLFTDYILNARDSTEKITQKNYEMLPALHEIFSKQYPQMLGVIYVLNYGWVHASLWGIVKQMISQEACERLLFLNQSQLREYIPLSSIPVGAFLVACLTFLEFF